MTAFIDTLLENITEIIQIITIFLLVIIFNWQRQDRKVQGAKFNAYESEITVKKVNHDGVDRILINATQIVFNSGDRPSWFRIRKVTLLLNGIMIRSNNHEQITILFSRFAPTDFQESTTFQFYYDPKNSQKSNESSDLLKIDYSYYAPDKKLIKDNFEIPVIFKIEGHREILELLEIVNRK